MAAQGVEPEIVLYDLACTKNVCFSPVVWRIRLLLNYKQIPYRTIFLEMPDIEPTLKELGLAPHHLASGNLREYTVPAIRHVPTNKYIMDSLPIAQFLESTYPDPPVPLTSELGDEIVLKSRSLVGPLIQKSLMLREVGILSPRSGEYFRRTREHRLGHRLEDLLDGEEELWNAADDGRRVIGELMRASKADGPFLLGARPSYADFFIAASLQSARVIDEGVFRRTIKYPGYKEMYEACLPYMERKD
ncbi:hypothetical protein Trco_000590 [Trichoderma cornu-damae]|uniref:GST N-terminal domain-containing protein n=1 Tax=Trichoderma cornu-damae TaxID=654480 RepID=A0A9P8QS83_9HYPO|nr:hypothetical protein Trco_000590 [Trichoderma cornu-damae]